MKQDTMDKIAYWFSILLFCSLAETGQELLRVVYNGGKITSQLFLLLFVQASIAVSLAMAFVFCLWLMFKIIERIFAFINKKIFRRNCAEEKTCEL